MKVKVISANLMVDYLKRRAGEVVEVSNDLGERFATAGLVEILAEGDAQEPTLNQKDEGAAVDLKLEIDGKTIDLSKASVANLVKFDEQYVLDVKQADGELKLDFAKRIYDAYIAKSE